MGSLSPGGDIWAHLPKNGRCRHHIFFSRRGNKARRRGNGYAVGPRKTEKMMNARFPALALALALAALAGACAPMPREAAPPVVAIVGATVVHPAADAAHATLADATVVVEGDTIRAVGARGSIAVPAGARVIDGRGKWLIPGLIDSHVHFFQSGNLYTRPDVADFNAWMPYAREVARNKAHLASVFKVWLANGVTSVIDVGGPFWNFDVRDQAARTAAAPRVEVA